MSATALLLRRYYAESDVLAPTLSSPTATVTSKTTADGSVSTDDSSGTLYWVVTASATGPSVAQVQAGQDHLGAGALASGSQAVSATGAQAVSVTGLTANTTYYIHYQHQDAAANDSTVVTSASFLTFSALTTVTVGEVLDEFVELSDASSLDSRDFLYMAQSWQSGAVPGPLTGLVFRMKKFVAPTGAIRVHVFAETGTYGSSSEPTGSSLVASVNFDAADLTGSFENYFGAITGFSPSAGTDYTAVMDFSGLIVNDVSNWIGVVYESGGDATHSGNVATSSDAVTWTPTAGTDLAFKVYHDILTPAARNVLGADHSVRYLGRD